MSSRPLTPPCVRFRTRRFNRISATTRTGLGCCSILPVRVFLLRLPFGHDYSLPCASRLCGNCLQPSPATPVFLIVLGSLLWSLVSSIVSRCSICIGGEATCPIPASLSSCLLSRSSPASPGCRPSHSASHSGHFCPGCGKSALSVWPWLSSRTLRVLECIPHSFPSQAQSPET